MSELKPCPFCTAEVILNDDYLHVPHVYHLMNGCLLEGDNYPMKQWNTRHEPEKKTVTMYQPVSRHKLGEAIFTKKEDKTYSFPECFGSVFEKPTGWIKHEVELEKSED